MYKTVSFNIFDMHLEDIVYKDRRGETSSQIEENENRTAFGQDNNSIPEPTAELPKKPFTFSKKAGA